MKLVLNSLVTCSLLMAGCASQSYCVREQRYEKAQSVQPVAVGGEGLSLPLSPTALKVPPAPQNDAPFGVLLADGHKDADGRRVQCLDQPPPLPAGVRNPASS